VAVDFFLRIGSNGHRGKCEDTILIAAFGDAVEIGCARDQSQARNGQIAEFFCKQRETIVAITFTDEIEGRRGAVMLGEPCADQAFDGLRIGSGRVVGAVAIGCDGVAESVPTGSIKTRSAASRSVSGFAMNCLAPVASGGVCRRGPSREKCSGELDAPGPPLKARMTERADGLLTSSRRYVVAEMVACVLLAASFKGISDHAAV